MADQIKPCSVAAKHKWTFQRNAQIRIIGQRGMYRSVGRYMRACGAIKTGPAQNGGRNERF